MYTSLVYNVNVATSITSQGRALISSATMLFESFLANNVKFGSINEVLQFIDNIISERPYRKYKDYDVIESDISLEDCFAKIILSCGWNWIPNYDEMEIVWNVLSHLDREDLNRIYYKNNLYEFMSNSKPLNLVKKMLHNLKAPLLNSLDIPEEIQTDIKEFAELLKEFVYYRYMYIDRIDRCDNMIKSVVMVSDTDSTIISLDAWYRFIVQQISGEELRIANYYPDAFIEDKDWRKAVEFAPKKYDYDFINEEIIDGGFNLTDEESAPTKNIRFSIINILAYVLDILINDYMIEFCKQNHSVTDNLNAPGEHELNRPCKIIMKNEFFEKMVKNITMITII